MQSEGNPLLTSIHRMLPGLLTQRLLNPLRMRVATNTFFGHISSKHRFMSSCSTGARTVQSFQSSLRPAPLCAQPAWLHLQLRRYMHAWCHCRRKFAEVAGCRVGYTTQHLHYMGRFRRCTERVRRSEEACQHNFELQAGLRANWRSSLAERA